ncbi:hypothetical protein TNCV_1566961 [Trichonephila clavipes]|nr:hypothetical protein TNCV_1566961 [Trichonephila clavipes]
MSFYSISFFLKDLAHSVLIKSSITVLPISLERIISWMGQGVVRFTEFCRITGHDCLRNHWYGPTVVPSLMCNLCSFGEVIDSAHLQHCSDLCKTFLVERQWEAIDMMD